MVARIHVESLPSAASLERAELGVAGDSAQAPVQGSTRVYEQGAAAGGELEDTHELLLPASAARHVQVLRLQPGSDLVLFDGLGGQWSAEVLRMGRSEVAVKLLRFEALEREAPLAIELAVCMPANDRMDDLVEKATELGVAIIQPLMSERSVLRLSGERAQRKQQHWQAVAVAACEQCGRNRVPQVLAPQALGSWLQELKRRRAGTSGPQWLLSLDVAAPPIHSALESCTRPREMTELTLLSGPEGGLSASEIEEALSANFKPVSLGPRTLRADTAALAATAAVVTWAERVSAAAGPRQE